MTYPRNYRDASRAAIENDIRHMNEGRLDRMMNHVGPEIGPRAKGIIEDELNQRKYGQMAAAAEQTLEEERGISTIHDADLEQVEQLGSLQDPDVGVEPGDLPHASVDPEQLPETVPEGGAAQTDTGATEPAPEIVEELQADTDLRREEAEVLAVAALQFEHHIRTLIAARQIMEQVLGALVLEAMLMEETATCLRRICETSPEIQVLSDQTIDRLLDQLWGNYSAEQRKEYLAPILEEDTSATLSIIKELAQDAGMGVESFK